MISWRGVESARTLHSKKKPAKPEEALLDDPKAPALRLQIAAELKLTDLPPFYGTSSTFINLIDQAGLHLLLSGWQATDTVVRFFNYWDMSHDANLLVKAELDLPDFVNYAGFASLFLKEVKDITLPVNQVRIRPPQDQNNNLTPLPERYVYLRAAYKIQFTDFAEFAARIQSDLVPFGRENEWFLGDVYMGVTNEAERFVQMWAIPQSQAAIAPQRLASASWNALAMEPPSYLVLQPTPADPVLGSNPMSLSGNSKHYITDGYDL